MAGLAGVGVGRAEALGFAGGNGRVGRARGPRAGSGLGRDVGAAKTRARKLQAHHRNQPPSLGA